MDCSPVPTGLAANSPSDVSYSSGASHTSTRTTSPSSSSHRSSPLLDLQHLTITNIEHASNNLLDPQPKMNQNTFQSVNERQDKLLADRGNGNTNTSPTTPNQLPGQLQQNQTLLRAPAPVGPQTAPRSLASANWRVQSINENIYNHFESTGVNMPHGGRGPTSFPIHPRLDLQHTGLASYPSMTTISDAQLNTNFSYCYDRGSGKYTRLIPADRLPPLRDVPALHHGCQGMIVLPQLRASSPNGRSSNSEPIAFQTSPPATPTTPTDNIQSRIDTIVASTPPTPTRGHHATAFTTTTNTSSSTAMVTPLPGTMGPHHHHHHHHSQPQRRPKIYCDKWVHEGVCAFTQQGCKYKHEMPFDKVTQHQLGLFHGLPAWWKKHQADLARQRDVPSVVSSAGDGGSSSEGIGSENTRVGGDRGFARGSHAGGRNLMGGGNLVSGSGGGNLAWRQRDQSLGGNGVEQSRVGGNLGPGNSIGAQGVGSRGPSVWNPSPFGPIAPPQRGPSGRARNSSPPCSIPTNNPYASLEALDESTTGDQEDGA